MHNHSLRNCFLAEVLGTFLLVLFGCGAVHVDVLAGALTGLWQVGIAWGLAIMLATYTIGPISGAHINPAITVGLAAWGEFPWRKVPAYVAAQLVGAFAAAAVLFGLWSPMLAAKEASTKVEVSGASQTVVRGQPGSEVTAMCYGEYFPNPGPLFDGAAPFSLPRQAEFNRRVPHLAAFLAEVLGTAILALVVCAVTNASLPLGPKNLAPAFIGLAVAALICIIAPLTQACFNPARDFGPRLFAALAGWGKIALPGVNGIGFVTVYILAPLLGGVAGIGLYQRWIGPTIARSRELTKADESEAVTNRDRREARRKRAAAR
jgi:glycerol uptake facilitator protein